jgi:hypothetical protein
MGAPVWGLFAAVVLFLSLEGFYLPTRFTMGPEGLGVRKIFSRAAIGWERFRRVYEDRHGLTLSPYRRRTFLEPYRSARVLYDGGDPGEIRRAVRRFCPGAEWIPPSGKSDAVDRAGTTHSA